MQITDHLRLQEKSVHQSLIGAVPAPDYWYPEIWHYNALSSWFWVRPFTLPNFIEIIHPGLTLRISKDETKTFHLKETEKQMLLPVAAALHTTHTSDCWGVTSGSIPGEGLVLRLDLIFRWWKINCLQQKGKQPCSTSLLLPPLHPKQLFCSFNGASSMPFFNLQALEHFVSDGNSEEKTLLTKDFLLCRLNRTQDSLHFQKLFFLHSWILLVPVPCSFFCCQLCHSPWGGKRPKRKLKDWSYMNPNHFFLSLPRHLVHFIK